MDHLYAVGDPVFGRDLWIVIELPSDDRGRRTRLGRQVRHVTDDVPYAAFSEGFLKFFSTFKYSTLKHSLEHKF